MFTSNIGRMRFFFYSLGVAFLEAMAALVCIVGTMGFEGFINSAPGPSRQGMAGAVLIVSLLAVVMRGNIAWRRSRDANGKGWILWSYIVFCAIYAFLQAGTLLVIDFNNPESTPSGLNLLALSIFGLWCTILVAKPVAGSNIDELTSVFDFEGAVPSASGRMANSAAPSTARAAAPATRSVPSVQPVGRPKPAGFGKRGL
ncbi:hypothetical protein JQK88_21150 [Mesorhizobium caraganae]|jgi:uncharacterized membrane protein YhaH (DUF805 family)|uniref:DUF805 domain-containing protein n=1 Tax=Mesorhizobium caraganae TaxID=483206 RepID=UPI001786E8A9|nr:hypothetical protein [Mesorhizobium caraganae]MBM2713674.1 hypothetical protein [Mesorhizobium caraganae]